MNFSFKILDVLFMQKVKDPVLPRNAIMLQRLTIQFPLYYLSSGRLREVKDGYCAYVLRISRYSDSLSLVLTNAGIFLRSLELCGESKT